MCGSFIHIIPEMETTQVPISTTAGKLWFIHTMEVLFGSEQIPATHNSIAAFS